MYWSMLLLSHKKWYLGQVFYTWDSNWSTDYCLDFGRPQNTTSRCKIWLHVLDQVSCKILNTEQQIWRSKYDTKCQLILDWLHKKLVSWQVQITIVFFNEAQGAKFKEQKILPCTKKTKCPEIRSMLPWHWSLSLWNPSENHFCTLFSQHIVTQYAPFWHWKENLWHKEWSLTEKWLMDLSARSNIWMGNSDHCDSQGWRTARNHVMHRRQKFDSKNQVAALVIAISLNIWPRSFYVTNYVVSTCKKLCQNNRIFSCHIQ